jgi:hypothetical protein
MGRDGIYSYMHVLIGSDGWAYKGGEDVAR